MELNLGAKNQGHLQVFSQPLSAFSYEEESKIKKEFIEQKDTQNGSEESDREEDIEAQPNDMEIKEAAEGQTDEIIEMELSTETNTVNQNAGWRYLPKQESNRIYYYQNWHSVDIKYLLLIKFMARHKLINLKQIAGIKQGYIGLNLKSGKMSVRSPLPSAIKTAIMRFSDYIDKLYVMNMDIQSVEVIRKIENFIKLREEIAKSKIVLFSYEKSRTRKQLLIGGEIRPLDLKNHMIRIRNSRISFINLRCFRNKRSYSAIIDEILKFYEVESEMYKFNQVKLMEVAHFNRDYELKLVICSLSKRPLLPQDYQEILINLVGKFYVLTFVFQTVRFIEKMSVPNVAFKIINEKKFPRSYLFVICLKENFAKLKEKISEEISKIGIKITGVRFFCNIYPLLCQLDFKKEDYTVSKYPPFKPYSMILTTHKGSEKPFDWREYMNWVANLENMPEPSSRTYE